MDMLTAKGAEYTARWPRAVAARANLSVEYVARALAEVTGAQVDRMALYSDEPLAPIGALEPEQATAVVARMREIRAEIRAHQATHCHFCGLALGADGECEECV